MFLLRWERKCQTVQVSLGLRVHANTIILEARSALTYGPMQGFALPFTDLEYLYLLYRSPSLT